MEIIKNIAAVVGCIAACLGLLATIIKPLRQGIINSFRKKTREATIDEKIDKMDQKIDQLLNTNKQLENRLSSVEKNVLTNEADRIRAELFDCGNRCRRGIRLHPEEMEHIRAIYHKYKDVLKQNHEGDAEFDFITKYYNKQDFPAYHTHQND